MTPSRSGSARVRSRSSRATGTSTAWAAPCASARGWSRPTATPKAIAFGAALDGVPESAAIGLTLLQGGSVSAALVGAVFLSNVPEALSSSAGSKNAGRPLGRVLVQWTGIVVISGIAAALGFVLFDGASDNLIAWTQAFAGGAVLCMLADTMMPQAFEDYDRRPAVGLVTVLGFAVAFLLVNRVMSRFHRVDISRVIARYVRLRAGTTSRACMACWGTGAGASSRAGSEARARRARRCGRFTRTCCATR